MQTITNEDLYNSKKTYKLKTKLLIGFGLTILTFVIASIITFMMVIHVKNINQNMLLVDLPTYNNFIDLNNELTHAYLDASKLIIRYDPERLESYNASLKNINERISSIDKFAKAWSNNGLINMWSEFKSLFAKLSTIHNRFISLSESNTTAPYINTSEANELFSIFDALHQKINIIDMHNNNKKSILDEYSMLLGKDSKQIIDNINLLTAIIIIATCLGTIIGIFISFYIIRHLNHISQDINESSHTMATMLEEVKSAMASQASGANEQAASINEVTASLTEIEKSSQQTMEKAKVLGDLADNSRKKGNIGLESLELSIKSMQSIRDKVETIAETILDLSKQTQQVNDITTAVNNFALQSKMLALNASIEAVKAGEFGKGFAVVASEVKNLAEQSEESTLQVQKILENIRHATEAAVMVTEEGTKGVDEGKNLVEKSGNVMRELNKTINEASIASKQIEAAVRQEAAGIEQITMAMNEINQVTVTFVSSIKQTNEAMENVSQVTKNLKSQIEMKI